MIIGQNLNFCFSQKLSQIKHQAFNIFNNKSTLILFFSQLFDISA